MWPPRATTGWSRRGRETYFLSFLFFSFFCFFFFGENDIVLLCKRIIDNQHDFRSGDVKTIAGLESALGAMKEKSAAVINELKAKNGPVYSIPLTIY